jgi:hypothetical protein
MGCEAGRERRSGGPGEAIGAASEWGARRAGGTDRAGWGNGSGRPVNGARGGPGEPIGRAGGTDRGGQ